MDYPGWGYFLFLSYPNYHEKARPSHYQILIFRHQQNPVENDEPGCKPGLLSLLKELNIEPIADNPKPNAAEPAAVVLINFLRLFVEEFSIIFFLRLSG